MPLFLWIFLVGLAVSAILTGYSDARALYHASRIFPGGFSLKELTSSYVSFQFGIVLYWISVYFMQKLGINSLLIQSLAWQSVLTVCAAYFDGALSEWPWWKFVAAVGAAACLAILNLPNNR